MGSEKVRSCWLRHRQVAKERKEIHEVGIGAGGKEARPTAEL